MRRFFAFINQVHHLQIDIDRAAQVEVNLWSVHRRLFGQPENQDLVDALIETYVVAYGLDAASVRPAAYHRAQGMLISTCGSMTAKKATARICNASKTS